MITILEKDHQKALDFLQELLYDWYDLIPPVNISGIGEEMYRCLKTEFGMKLPSVSDEILSSMNDLVAQALSDGEEGKWACDYIFTILEDEELIQIVKW